MPGKYLNSSYNPQHAGNTDTRNNEAGEEWTLYQSPDGYPYYYNSRTGESIWAEHPSDAIRQQSNRNKSDIENGYGNKERLSSYSNNLKDYNDGKLQRSYSSRSSSDSGSPCGSGSSSGIEYEESDSDFYNDETNPRTDLESQSSVYRECSESMSVNGLKSSRNSKHPRATSDREMEKSFKLYLQTPQGLATMMAEQTRIEKKIHQKVKPTHNTLPQRYDPKSKSFESSENAFISVLGATYAVVASMYGPSSSSESRSKDHRNRKNKETMDVESCAVRRSGGSRTLRRSRIPLGTMNKPEHDSTGRLNQRDSCSSSDSLDSMSSGDSDVILIKSPLLPKWISWQSLSHSVQSVLNMTTSGPPPDMQSTDRGDTPDNIAQQRTELWERARNSLIEVAQNIGSRANVSLVWAAQATCTGAALVAVQLWNQIDSVLLTCVDDAAESALKAITSVVRDPVAPTDTDPPELDPETDSHPYDLTPITLNANV